MKAKNLFVLLSIFLAAFSGNAQSDLTLSIHNNSESDVTVVVTFNQTINLSSPPNSPTSFTVASGATYVAHYKPDEYDVNFASIKFTESGTSPGHWTSNAMWLPVTFGSSSLTAELISYSGQGIYEALDFEIN